MNRVIVATFVAFGVFLLAFIGAIAGEVMGKLTPHQVSALITNAALPFLGITVIGALGWCRLNTRQPSRT